MVGTLVKEMGMSDVEVRALLQCVILQAYNSTDVFVFDLPDGLKCLQINRHGSCLKAWFGGGTIHTSTYLFLYA